MYNNVSNTFKREMDYPLRNRMFLQVSLGIVNQDAQSHGTFTTELTAWSNAAFPWRNKQVDTEYATLEDNYFKADGSMKFLPEGNVLQYEPNVGIATKELNEPLVITFDASYDLKGLTIKFGRTYPTKFNIITDAGTYYFENDSQEFLTTDNLGRSNTLTIEPVEMVGGQQRMRIENILMGVGLNYTNSEIQTMNFSEKNNGISAEVPSTNFDLTIVDPDQIYDVDKIDSFINYLQTGQTLSMSMGLELSNGTVEYIPMCKLLLSTWSAKQGIMSFNAVDKFTLMDDYYESGYTIAQRTFYDAIISVLTYLGYEADEYVIDDFLQTITTSAPLPRIACRELLQLLANAGRCIMYQDREGKIVFKANFGNVLDPEDVLVTSTSTAHWSQARNVMKGATETYADLTNNFFSADGSMRFLPESGQPYLNTGFVSSICGSDGTFTTAPTLTLTLEAGFVYYGMTIVFGGNPPKEIQIDTYYQNEHVQTVTHRDCEPTTYIAATFNTFDEMVISFKKAFAPYSRVLVNKVTFGELTDYNLTYDNIIGDVLGFRDTKIKNVLVKVYSYVLGDNGEPQEVQDNVYATYEVNPSGQNITITNPLIDSMSLANQVAEWVAFYYSNNVNYSLDYRGDPRLNAADLIFLESPTLNNLQAEIESHKLNFDGTLTGSLELKRAIRTS